MKIFYLKRVEDESGISGTGRIAQGAIFDNGKVALTWLSEQKRIGWMGEKLAALYLKGKGLKILEMNRNCPPHGEIDIIARDDDEIVFVEVKTAFKTNPDLLDEKVDKDKLKKISHAIYQYQKETEQIDDIRIDCISVILQKKKPIIKYFEGIRLE